jgi:hypothetical protein
MCNCHSYNAGTGDVPEVLFNAKDYFEVDKSKIVCIDACISEQIKMLWQNGIWTLGSCCGHNGLFGDASVIIANNADPKKVKDLLKKHDPKRQWVVKQWQLVDCI